MRAALAEAAVRAQAECGGRATAAAKIHVTLFFVGDVERSRIAELDACAAAVAATPFELDMSALGYWRHNRIVWAGARGTPEALRVLVARLASNLSALGFKGEDRPYVAHATLVRNARRAPAAVALDVPSLAAREFALVES